MKVKDLYKVDMLAFDSKIGYITNLGTTFYEMQSQYEKGSKEYEELSRRLMLCCIEQNRTIDAAKGLETKPFPKHWTSFQKINDDDTEEEKARKEFENKLVIEKKPEFMKHLYSHYSNIYKTFKDDFNLYSQIKFGKKIDDLTEEDKQNVEIQEMLKYYDKKNPLLETNGVMNKVCRYMESKLKDINKKSKNCDNQKIFDKIFNHRIELDNKKLDLMIEKYKQYLDFKKTKQLANSPYSTYEQYFKYLRNDCLEKISCNIKELANLSVYICYKLYPNKPKDFCWDVFGGGIVDNLSENKLSVSVPHLDENGDIEYLGQRYKMDEVLLTSATNDLDLESDFNSITLDDNFFEDLDEDDLGV